MDYNYPNKGKITVHSISGRGTAAVAVLDLWACAGCPSSVSDPFTGETSFIFPPAADCAAVGIHSSNGLWSSARGNSTEAHICFTGVWEEAPLVRLSSAVLCSDCWPHRCLLFNIQMQWPCICLKIPHVPLHFQTCTGSVTEKMKLLVPCSVSSQPPFPPHAAVDMHDVSEYIT